MSFSAMYMVSWLLICVWACTVMPEELTSSDQFFEQIDDQSDELDSFDQKESVGIEPGLPAADSSDVQQQETQEEGVISEESMPFDMMSELELDEE